MIRDARQMLRGIPERDELGNVVYRPIATAADLREYVELNGTHDGGATVAYVNHGRWVADCPECNAGIAVWPDHPLTACGECGAVLTLEVPDADTRAAAEIVLSKRSVESVRNWRPDGETVEDLQAENALRGVDFTRRRW